MMMGMEMERRVFMTSQAQRLPFPGINPHLNSALQALDGGWRMAEVAAS